LTAKGITLFRGGFYLAKEKAFETGGKFSKKILKMLFFEIIFIYHWLIAKEFKRLFQKICKN
jgi:hypothetical protein